MDARFDRLRNAFHRLLDVPLPLRSAALAQVDSDLHEELLALLDQASPARIGPYRIEKELGRGGMGVVYLARRDDGAFEQAVALKRMHHGLGPERAQRFARERAILSRLQHPHIAKLLDGGIDRDGQPWLAMELIDGTTLMEARLRLSVDQRLGILIELCEAVAYAHAALVIHRDIKPGNVMLASDGHPRLLDFGIAKLEDDSDQCATLTDLRPMTPRYAAPEQHRGEIATTAVDVYAIGRLIAELLGDELTASAKRIADRATHEQATARYPSATALADDLRDARAGKPLRSGIDSRRERTMAFARIHRWPLLAGGTVAAALAVGGIGFAYQARVAAHEAAQARAHLATLIDVISAVSPDRYRGREPPAGDLLLAAASVLANRKDAPPALVLEASSELAAGLINLGRFEDAQIVLDRALRIGAALTASETIDALRLWALIVDHRETALMLAQRIEAAHLSTPSGPALNALSSIAATLAGLGETERARQLLDLASARALAGTVSIGDTENVQRQRARALMHLGDLDGAAAAWAEVVQLHQSHRQQFSPERQAEAAWLRAEVAMAQGALELAASELERARPVIEVSYPADHPERQKFDRALAKVRLRQSSRGDTETAQ